MEGGLDDAVNMDVMMDNMTDVVGTLLMVLIIVQLKVNNTIDNIQSNLPVVTQQQVVEVRQQAAALKTDIDFAAANLQDRVPDEAKMAAEIQAIQENLRQHETTLQKNDVQLVELEKLQQQLAEKRKELELAKREMTKLIDEREKLRGLLDNTPIPVIPPAKVVRMPAARPIPEGADMVRVLCANGRVYLVDMAFMKRISLEAFAKSRNALILTRGAVTPGKDTNIYDHAKTAAVLNKRELGNREFKIEFPVIKTQNRMHMQIKPQPKAGETPDEFEKPQSLFGRFLRVAKRNPKAVVWFLVYPDSFETYLRARDVCDQAGVPAGWELSGSPWLAENLYEFETNVIEPPPPPKPPEPGAVSIPAPKKTLD
jgi:hypothetical protein